MIGLVFSFLLFGAAFAQLPPAQAPLPRAEPAVRERRRAEKPPPAELVRVDAVVSDAQGSPIPGLTAADFTVEADGKPQKVESCEYSADRPLRVAVIIDDLNLSLEHLNSARRALRQFVAALRRSDEAAILHTGSGTGALDRFTSDQAALQAAIGRATYDPESAAAPPAAFTAGALGAVRAVLEGMQQIPGRKAVLLISERLRDPQRGGQLAWALRLTSQSHRASAVFYAVDMGDSPEQPLQLEQGLADVARDSGGQLLDRGRVAEALSRITRDQSAYYVLTYRADGLSFDYLAGTPRVSHVTVKTSRGDALVLARNGVFGALEDAVYRDDRDFQPALASELTGSDMNVRVTGIVSMDPGWQISALIHIDAHDITFIRGLGGGYRATLETAVALYGDAGAAVKSLARTVDLNLGAESFQGLQKHGFDYTMTLPIPAPGGYQLRAAVRDAASGKIGSARQFVRAEWGAGKLEMSSIVVRGQTGKSPAGVEELADPEESQFLRSYKAGRKFTYSYDIYNLATDAEKRSAADVRTQIWRDGVVILATDPAPISFSAAEKRGSDRVGGIVTLKPNMAPGHYVLGVTVTDKYSPRTVSRFTDFDVRP